MEAQGLSQGSLRNSHRETHAIQRKPAAASLQDLASKVLETCFKDTIIRQRLDPERVEPLLKRAPFFVLENESRAEPGFLVFLPEKPAIYLQQRRGRDGGRRWCAYTLRLRVSSFVSECGGTVLLARLDDVMHGLQLEDVWLWRGEAVYESKTFTDRRSLLREFVERHWVPDARLLGGILTTVAAYKSLEEFAARKESRWKECYSVEFVPDAPGRRRMVLYLEERVEAASGPAGLKQERRGVGAPGVGAIGTAAVPPPSAAPPSLEIGSGVPTPTLAPPVAVRRAKAVAVDKLPDVYDLYGEDGFPISRASVQQFALSQQLRAKIGAGEAWVLARWKADFGGYEIIGLAPPRAINSGAQ
jgi:hypothetical protein